MRRSLPLAGVATVAMLALAGCSTATDSGADGEANVSPESITISLVPSVEGENLAEALGPLTDYLSENLGIEVNGVVASDYSATVEALGSGQADVISTDAGSLYNAIERFDAQLILRDVRFGATSYASVAFTNNPDKYCADEPVLAAGPEHHPHPHAAVVQLEAAALQPLRPSAAHQSRATYNGP